MTPLKDDPTNPECGKLCFTKRLAWCVQKANAFGKQSQRDCPRTVVLKQGHSPCQRAPGHVWRRFWLSQWGQTVPLASRGLRSMFYMHSRVTGAVENPCAEQERVKRHNDKKQWMNLVLTKSPKKILRDIGKPKCGLFWYNINKIRKFLLVLLGRITVL